MLSRMGPALTSGGFLVIPNLYTPWMADYDSLATWKDWIQFTSGAAQEFFTKWGTTNSGWFAGSDWTYRQSFQAATEDAGKIFLGITYAPKADARSMQYARANFLLFEGASSKSALIYEASDPEAQDPFSAQWTGDVGSPSGPRFQVGAAWRRNFSGGTVLVNPSTSTVTVDLGQPYVDANGTTTSSVSLAPTTGAVLTTAAGGGGTPPPPPGPPPPTPPPPPAQISLTATLVGTAVQLTWLGMPATRVDVYRNGGKIANVANSGSYRDQLSRNAKGTFTYRVCAAGTSTCSAKVSVVVRRVKLATASSLSSWQVLARFSFRLARS
jgi:hypothetical protein